MTAPSKVVAAVVRTLKAALGGDVVDVRAIQGAFGADLNDLTSAPSPGVFVALLRMPLSARDYDPPAFDGRFVAVVVARDPRLARGELTRDEVAANIAARVTSIVATSRFPDAGGEPVMSSAAFNVAAVNAFQPELMKRGLALWRVEWSQTFEFAPADAAPTLAALREIRMRAEVGDAGTPDVEAWATDLEG